MNDPENKDLKPQDDTAEQPNAAQQESDGTELSDEELGDAAGGFLGVPHTPVSTNGSVNFTQQDPGTLENLFTNYVNDP